MNESQKSSLRSEPLIEARANMPNWRKYSLPFNLREHNMRDTGFGKTSSLSGMLRRYQSHVAQFCSNEKRLRKQKKETVHKEHIPSSPEKYCFQPKKFPRSE
jgi:tellurite resistance-related uncharacterized protein